jgi:hypothetical protein
MRPRFRPFAALVAIVAFLFAQAATSAFACAGPVPDPVAMAQMKAQMGEDGGLCEKHCATGTVSMELAKPATAAMPALVAGPVRIVAVAPLARAVATRAQPLSVAGPAPPLIRFTVLRI